MTTTHRQLIGGLVLLACATWAQAQAFPTKAVRVTTSFPAGSGADVALRVVSDKLSKLWGQPVLVDNKPGGNGFIAADVVKRGTPDGHELLQLDSAQMTAQQYLFKKMPYDTLRDFEPVTPIFRNYFFLTVGSNSPYKTLGELLQAAKAQPDKMDYGSWFVGSPGHLGAAMLEYAAGVKMNHIAYKEMAQLYTGVSNQEVAWAFGSVGSTSALYKSGRLRYLAVASPRRAEAFADVPTVAEAGGPAGFELAAWVGWLAPKGTPKAIVEKIQRDVATVLADPDLKARYAVMQYEPYALNTEQFLQLLRADGQRYGETIRRMNITLD